MQELVDRASCLTLHQITGRSLVSKADCNCSATARPWIHLSFDDGWLGSVEEAGPILERHGCSATLFVTTDLIGKPGFVDSELLRQLPVSTFAIGSHGRSHRPLARLATDELRGELSTSKQVLEDLVQYEVDTLSVPGGSWDERVRRITAETGYKYIFTSRVCRNRTANPSLEIGRMALEIGRVAIKETTSRRQFDRLLRHRLWCAQWTQRAKQTARRLLGRTLYARLRSELLHENAEQSEMTDLTAAQASITRLPQRVSLQGGC